MTTNASRAPIDFDAFERELQPSSQQGEARSDSPKGDPLAELARIVGQDDPFRALLEARGTARPAQQRIEPSFEEPAQAASQSAPTPADAFDQYLASVEQSHQSADYADPAAFESDDRDYQNAASAQPRARNRLVQVGAGLGVLVLCVTGAFAWKGLHGGVGGSGPVTVLADKSPLKIAPEKADGVDIPDQNKQIYDRTAKDGQIKVVNREEQPLDVAQAARAASRDNGNQGGVTPGGSLLTESLGEPRRIRTVAVKPDTPPPAMQQQREQAEPASEYKADAKPEPKAEPKSTARHASASPIPTMMMPDGAAEGPATPPNPTMKGARQQAATPAPATPRSAATTTPMAETPAADEPAATPAATPASRRTLKRVASVAPETTASTGEPEAAATPAPTASVGGFSVQLGVRNSEADAHAAFQQMRSKHAQLAGKPELIRQAEVNGKSLYRVRVGPLSKAEANSLCNTLKGAGSPCFVAAN